MIFTSDIHSVEFCVYFLFCWMMDIESPLNLAHQQGRRIPRLLQAKKFDEAIVCHQKAAEFLEQALESTDVEKALESIRLQREYHIKQQLVVKDKKNRALRAALIAMNGGAVNDSEEPHTLTEVDGDNGELTLTESSSGQQVINGKQDEIDGHENALNSLEETDSLLQFLQTKGVSIGPESIPVRRFKYTKRLDTSTAVKIPKDDKLIIEELVEQNKSLRHYLKCTLEENDKLKQDLEFFQMKNEVLEEKIKRLESNDDSLTKSIDSDQFFSIPAGQDSFALESLNVELPPLELPTFNFDEFTKDK